MLAEDALLALIFDQLEQSAIERGISAKPNDDETRAISAMEVRTIRSVRRELKSLASGKTTPAKSGSVA